MSKLYKGINEGQGTIYNDEEEKILNTNFDIKALLNELEERKK